MEKLLDNIYLDNIVYYLQGRGGITTYWSEISKNLMKFASPKFVDYKFGKKNSFAPELSNFEVLYEDPLPIKFLRYLPLTTKIDNNALFHSSYYRISNQRSIKNILTIHDFIYEIFAKNLKLFIHSKQKQFAIRESKGIICISNTTKSDLFKYYPNLLQKKEIVTIYNGVSADYFHISNKEIIYNKLGRLKIFSDRKYILFVGSRVKYKNFNYSVEVVSNLPDQYVLLIVGDNLSDSEINILNRKLGTRYLHLRGLNNISLNYIYNISECLIYPSEYEGFGIPIIEAFKTGCPVITKDLNIFKEISDGNTLILKDFSIKSAIDNILLLNRRTFREELSIRCMDISNRYSWEKASLELLEFYNYINDSN